MAFHQTHLAACRISLAQITDTKIRLTNLIVRNATLTLQLADGVRWDCHLAGGGRLRSVGSRMYRVVDGQRVEL